MKILIIPISPRTKNWRLSDAFNLASIVNTCKKEMIIPVFISEPKNEFYQAAKSSCIYKWGFPSERPDFELSDSRYFDEFYVAKTIKELLKFYNPTEVFFCDFFDRGKDFYREIQEQFPEADYDKFCKITGLD